MIHEILAVGPLHCNCSILGDETSREAIVVDPGDDISRIVSLLQQHQLTVKQILVTHAHIDHIAGAQRLKQLTGAPVLYNQNDLPLVQMMDVQAGWLGIATPEVAPPDDNLTHGRLIAFGAHPELGQTGLTGSILHTPGHTEGSVCLYLPEQSLLLAGNTRKLLHSIHDQLLPLPDATRVIPGHGAATTIGVERDSNPFLQSL